MQQKLALALREYRLLYVANTRGSAGVPHNKLIFPPALRYLPVWILGALRSTDQSLTCQSHFAVLSFVHRHEATRHLGL